MDNRRSLVVATCNDRKAVENIRENRVVRADIFPVFSAGSGLDCAILLAVKSTN